MDAVHYKIKEDGRYIGKANYTLLGLTLEGKKELLGLYLSENEGATYSALVSCVALPPHPWGRRL
ncbi:MAG: putative transposase [Gammaproteobacteria bacterium]|jgi:putative transposase